MKKLSSFLVRHWLAVILLSSVIFLILTVSISSMQSVWFDEDYSIVLAKSSWRQLFNLTAVDAHPPLYYVILKIWGTIGGFGDLWLRLFSSLCATGAVVTVFLIIKKHFGTRIVLVAAPILALSPFLMRYGFEIRMYSLAALVAAVSTYFLLRLNEESSRKCQIIYGVSVAIGMLTLNYMIFVFLAQAIWLLMNRAKGKKTLKIWQEPWFKSYILAVLLYLPWLPFAVSQLMHDASAGIATAIGPIEIVKILSFTFLYQPEYWLGTLPGFLLVATVISLAYVIPKSVKSVSDAQRPIMHLLLLIAILPIIMMMFLSLVSGRGFFVERYMAHFVFAGYAAVAISLSIFITKSQKKIVALSIYVLTIAVLITGVMNLFQYGNYNFQRMQNNAMRQVISEMGGCRSDWPIIVDDNLVYFEVSHYISNCQNLYFYSPYDIGYRGGYAPLANNHQKITNQKLNGSRLTIVRIKDQPHYEVPTDYHLISVDNKYDVISVEIYER